MLSTGNAMQLVLISGLSGSGKSVALNVMEDGGHYVVDNLPSALLPHLVTHLRGAGYQRIAVAVDVRSGASIAALPQQYAQPVGEAGTDGHRRPVAAAVALASGRGVVLWA